MEAEEWEAWLKRDHSWPDNCRMAYECGLKAQGWRDAARSLRQPYNVRLEREAYG